MDNILRQCMVTLNILKHSTSIEYRPVASLLYVCTVLVSKPVQGEGGGFLCVTSTYACELLVLGRGRDLIAHG